MDTLLRPLAPVWYLLLPLAFALGAIPFGFVAGRLKGVDLREAGSGNIGATNTMRVLGVGPGVAVLVLDALKGYLPVAVASALPINAWWIVATGLCAVLGHIYSPWVRFKGGKGVATSLGVLIGLSPLVALSALAAFGVVTAVTRYVSLGSIVGAWTQAALFCALPGFGWPYRLFGLTVALFVTYRHRANIARLRAGTESRVGKKKIISPDAANEV